MSSKIDECYDVRGACFLICLWKNHNIENLFPTLTVQCNASFIKAQRYDWH